MRIIPTLALCAFVTATAVQAEAKASLGTVTQVSNGILIVGIANEIRKKCPSIDPRLVKAYFFMNSLKSHAKKLGYSSTEIDAYLDNKEEEAKIKMRGEAYLIQNGITKDDPETYCALGRTEIKKSSQIGALLKAK